MDHFDARHCLIVATWNSCIRQIRLKGAEAPSGIPIERLEPVGEAAATEKDSPVPLELRFGRANRALAIASQLPWYPFLLSGAYVSNGFADFHIHVALLPRALLIAIAGTALVLAAFAAITWRIRVASAASGVLGCLLLTPAPLTIVLMMAAAGAAAIFLLDRSGRIQWSLWCPRLNGYALLLIAVVGGRWVLGGGIQQTANDLRQLAPAASVRADGPDIYLLLLDGYPRADTQRSLFSVDPGALLAELGRLGFDHYPRSFAEYPSTNQTLASMLFMDDLAAIDIPLNSQGHAPQPEWRQALNANPAFEIARAAGYEVVTINPGWDAVALRHADRFIDTGGISHFEQALVAQNGYGALIEAIAPAFFGDQRRHRVSAAFHTLETLSAERNGRPRLVWVHVPAPHYPVLWNADGSSFPVSLADFSRYHREAPRRELLDEYGGNLRHLNELVVKVVSRVVANDPSAVVVVFSDHGSTGLGNRDEVHASFLAAKTPGYPWLFAADPTPRTILGGLLAAYLE